MFSLLLTNRYKLKPKFTLLLTDKEKRICLIKYIVHGNSPFADEPIEKRIEMLEAACLTIGLDYDDSKMQELGREILDFQAEFIEIQNVFVGENTDVLARVKGNEEIEKIVGTNYLKKAMEKLGKGKA